MQLPIAVEKKATGKKYLTLVFILFFISYYLEVPVYFGPTFYVPSLPTFFLLVIAWLTTPIRLTSSDYRLMMRIAVLCAVSVLISSLSYEMSYRLNGAAQLIASAAAGIVFMRLGQKLDATSLERLFIFLSSILVALGVAERMGLLGISDVFRLAAYSRGGYEVYGADDRDLLLASSIRPKVFTSEPSLLAIGVMVSSVSAMIINPTKKNLVLLSCVNGALIWMLLSPISVVAIGVLGTIYWLKSWRRHKSRSLVFVIVFIGVTFMALLDSSIVERLSDSGLANGNYSITSENLRLVFPLLSTFDVLSVNPLFGLGIGGKRSLGGISSLGLPFDAAYGSNNVAALIMSFGIIGSLCFLVILYKYIKAESGAVFLTLLCVVALSLSMGGLESPRFIGYVFCFFLAISRSQVFSKYYHRS